MESEIKLVSGAMVALAVATAALVVLPYMEVRDIQPPPGLKPYTSAELRGRAVYIANGCVYCHSQQPRDRKFGPDFERGWGRASVPGDYTYDKPHLLGSMRTGPDLFNMPSYPFLFTVKDAKEAEKEGEQPVALPLAYGPNVGQVVVPTPEALDLVKYLLALNHTYPVLPPAPKP